MGLGRTTATGRASAVRTYTLADLPGLKWWAEPDSISATGSAVDAWTDKSAAATNLAEVGANRPTLVTNALNGFNGVQVLAATNQRLHKDNIALLTAKAFTFGLVMRVDAVVADSAFLSYVDVQTTLGGFELYSNSGKYDINHVNAAIQDADTISTGTFRIITYRFSGTSCGFYRSGRGRVALSASTIAYSTPGATIGLTIGARNHNFVNPASATYVAGFLCDGYLTDGQVLFAENFWKTKYPSLA